MSEEIMNAEENTEVMAEDSGTPNPMLEYIAATMKIQMVDANVIRLEFPLSISLTVDPDFHYSDLFGGMTSQGCLYLAKAMWEQSRTLEDIVEYLPVLDSERERAESVEEVVESE